MGDVGTSYPGALTIGRVMVREEERGRGLATALMRRAISDVRAVARDAAHADAAEVGGGGGADSNLSPPRPIMIGAQAHLSDWYTRLGFEAVSEVYDEDGIPHLDMQLLV